MLVLPLTLKSPLIVTSVVFPEGLTLPSVLADHFKPGIDIVPPLEASNSMVVPWILPPLI